MRATLSGPFPYAAEKGPSGERLSSRPPDVGCEFTEDFFSDN